MVGRRAVRQGGLPAGSLALRTRAGIYSPSPQSSPVKGDEEHPSGWPSIVGWGKVPALHLSFDPRLSLFGRRRLVSPAGAGIHPGSESGTCFRTKTGGGLASPHPPGFRPRIGVRGMLPIGGMTVGGPD